MRSCESGRKGCSKRVERPAETVVEIEKGVNTEARPG